ncbi:MAG: N-formylglutamate amidohydrolase, partial [Gammaproteobacteria bacterium]|nr:N-formylglutamate amidohydrolase [Gammaproteobacteria bacterium]
MSKVLDVNVGEGPLIAVANHGGHELREEVAQLMALDEDSRLREEDPYTNEWAAALPTHILMRRSRFEVDLNRPREEAVYLTPDDAWGLNIWKHPLPEEVIERSRAVYDEFYEATRQVFSEKAEQHGLFVAFDLHSYNHKREGPDGPEADPLENPEVNVGTGTMDRDY